MSLMDRWISRTRRRLELGRFLSRAADWITVYLCLFGGCVLLVKLVLPGWWPRVLWIAPGIVPVLLVGWFLIRPQRFTHEDAVCLLDSRMQARGLLMTLSETQDGIWRHHLPQVDAIWRAALPRVRGGRFLKRLLFPLAFAVAACLVPLTEGASPRLNNTISQETTAELTEMLEQLESEQVIDAEEKQELLGELTKLAAESADSPLTHEQWEILDAIRERMQLRLDAASLTNARALDAALALAQATTGENIQLTPERRAQLETAVAAAMQQFGNDEQALAKLAANPAMQQIVQQFLSTGQLRLPSDPQTRAQMLEQLQGLLRGESARLSALRSEAQSSALGNTLGRQFFSTRDDTLAPGGLGSDSRGGGDADRNFGRESAAKKARFKSVILPPGILDRPRDEIERIVTRAPEVTPAESAPRSVQRELDPTAGRETWNRRVSPRHRDVLREYFNNAPTQDTEAEPLTP